MEISRAEAVARLAFYHLRSTSVLSGVALLLSRLFPLGFAPHCALMVPNEPGERVSDVAAPLTEFPPLSRQEGSAPLAASWQLRNTFFVLTPVRPIT